nr:MAG TPA: Chromatin remodeling complex ATPase [Bacteriophage sp.]
MALSLDEINKAYHLLKEYNGTNPYIINLKNDVYAYKNKTLNNFNAEFVLNNFDKEPILINKLVHIIDWWAQKKQEDWGLEFTPKKLKITHYLGETKDFYCFYCLYRKSQPKAVMCFAPKKAILTDFLAKDHNLLDIDFTPYNEASGRKMMPYQEEAVKFLTAHPKAILASAMGSGKTFSAIVAALVGNYKHILIIAPASVKKTWENELSLLVPKEDVTIVNGSEWNDARFTIINYDILKNFYTIPTHTVKVKELNVNDNGNVISEIKEKEVISRKRDVISKAMSTSQLFKSRFDLIIIDEAHRLSNTSSGRYKIISDFVQRAKPKGIFELTGTPITNRPINFFNLLKVIDCPLANDWKYYVLRYCDGKSFYKKNERDAYTALYLKNVKKKSWFDLTDKEKETLNEILERKCKKIWKTDGASNLDELQEVIKPYYLRRMKEEFGDMVSKQVKVLHYDLSDEQRKDYNQIWGEYLSNKTENIDDFLEINKVMEDAEKYKKITEGTLLRQWLAHEMLEKTISLVRKCVDKGHKVVVFCSFDDEVNTLKEEFGDIAVQHNGKMLTKKKDLSVERFQNDPNIKVFIGNINSAGVGLTLVASNIAVFNSFSWVSGDNLQAEDRIHRLNQKKNCTVYYQVFKDTFYEKMFDKVRGKQDIIDNIIVSENEK